MAVPKANQRAVNKYVKNNYDRINVTMPKGKKADIQSHAAAQGESVNGFINRAIDHEMERDIASQKEADSSAESEEKPPTAFTVQVRREEVAPRVVHVEVEKIEKVKPVQFKVAVEESKKIEPIRFVVGQSDDKGTVPATSESQTEEDPA